MNISTLVTGWNGLSTLVRTVIVTAIVTLATVAILAVAFHHKTVVSPVPVKEAATLTAQAVNTAASETSQEAAGDSYVAAAKVKVHEAKDAQDTEGDAGDAGIVALCGLREYASDPACAVQRDDTGRVENAGSSSSSAGKH
jgi:hypothetical protein